MAAMLSHANAKPVHGTMAWPANAVWGFWEWDGQIGVMGLAARHMPATATSSLAFVARELPALWSDDEVPGTEVMQQQCARAYTHIIVLAHVSSHIYSFLTSCMLPIAALPQVVSTKASLCLRSCVMWLIRGCKALAC